MLLLMSLMLVVQSILTTTQEVTNPDFVYLELSESTESSTTAEPSDYVIRGGNQAGLFGLYKNTVVLTGKLDYENQSHHILSLSFKRKPEEIVTVFVNVLNDYDEVPEVILESDVYGISEELALGTDVGKMFDVRDADIGDSFTYALSGEDARFFHIDGTSGRMTMQTRIDRDGPSGVILLHHLRVKVTDKGNNSIQQSLTIEILDINDNPPRFQKQLYTLHVNPTQTESTIGQLVVQDDDRYGADRFITNPTIVGGNADQIFSLNANYLHADMNKLFERPDNTFSLLVEAKDPSTDGQESTAVVVVQVSSRDAVSSNGSEDANKYSPEWIYPVFRKRKTVVSVLESTPPGEVVLSVQAGDEDEGLAGQIRYSFTPTSTAKRPRSSRPKTKKANAAGMFFVIDPEKGNLTVAMPLDRDKKTGGVTSFTIDITATDTGRPPRSITAKVKLLLKNANDNAPSFSQHLYMTSYGCDVDLTRPIYIFTVTDDDNDNIKTVVIVDAESKRRYSLFKQGRPYALKAKFLPDPHVDKVDVITVSASDGDKISTAKILVRVRSCSSREEPNSQDGQTSTEASPSPPSASTDSGSEPELTAPSSVPTVVTTRSVTSGGEEVLTVCSTTKVTTNNASSVPVDTVTPLPLSTPAVSPSPASTQPTAINRCQGRDSNNRFCCYCTGNRSGPRQRDVPTKTSDDRKYPNKLHNNVTSNKTKVNSTRNATSNGRCRCSNGADDSSSYSSSTISAIAATSVIVPCILATGVFVKKFALRRKLSVRDTPPEVTDSPHAPTDRPKKTAR